MEKDSLYLFTSKRLGFREWQEADIKAMIAINSNKDIMKFFPAIPKRQQTIDFIQRMQLLFAKKKYCYFAVDLLESSEFIGFIGLNDIRYEAPFSGTTDIGWRLAKQHWGKGYATEGAKRCIEYAFSKLQLSRIVAIAPVINLPSISVMKKIGMTKKMEFYHPSLTEHPALKKCVCFEIKS